MRKPPHVGSYNEYEIFGLAMERAAEFKNEFFQGEIFAMADRTPMHSLIATNLAGELRNVLKGRPCVPFNADLRLMLPRTFGRFPCVRGFPRGRGKQHAGGRVRSPSQRW